MNTNDYYSTYEGKFFTVSKTLEKHGISNDSLVHEILADLSEYSSRYAFKCTDPWCPKLAGTTRAGFPSLKALEQHQLVDHKRHGFKGIQWGNLGLPNYICLCGFVAHLSDREVDLFHSGEWIDEPVELRNHLNHGYLEL